MGLDGIGEVGGDRASAGQTAGIYGAGVAAKSLARLGAWDWLRIKVGSDKEFTEIKRVKERNREDGTRVKQENVMTFLLP